MTEKEAIYILRNAAWLGSNEERQKVEEAVEVVAKAIEAQNMTLYMNLPEVSVEEAVEILKRNNRIELLPSGEDTNVPSTDTISRQDAIDVAREELESGTYYDIPSKIESLPPAEPEIIRCKDCRWFGDEGCAILIVDDSDKPKEDDFCSFAEKENR